MCIRDSLIIPAGYEAVFKQFVEKTYADNDIYGCACCKQSHKEYIESHIHADSGGGDKSKAEIGKLENLAFQTVYRYTEHPLDDGCQGHYEQRVKRIHRQTCQQLVPFRKVPYPVSYTHLDVYKRQDVCHEIHVTVEGEYGEMPSNVTGQGRALPEGESLEFFFTKPDKAARYVEQTGVDSLVVSFGSVHGIYIEEPKMDYERLGARCV